jgi:hypothetical protein
LIADKRASLRDEMDQEPPVKHLTGGYSEINPKVFTRSA